MVFSKLKKMSKWGVAASITVALLGAGSAAYAGFSVGSIGSAKGLKATPSTDVFGNSLDNLILGQLSTEDLDSAGIDYSACGSSPLPSYVLDYLETQLSTDAEDTSEWQSEIDAISDCDLNAAEWQVGEANDGDAAITVVTASLLDAIIGTDGYTNAVLAANSSTDISDVQALFPSALATITASSVKNMVAVTAVGFENTTKADAYQASDNASTHTVSSFEACYDSTESLTVTISSNPGCDITKSSWDSISALDTASSPDDLTDDDLEGIIEAASVSDSDGAFGDLSALTSVESDYLRDCMGSTVTSSALSTCVTDADNTSVPVFNVAKKVAGDYSEAITVSDIQNAGIGSVDTASGNEAVITYLSSNTCGASSNSSCTEILTNVCGSDGSSACGDTSLVSAGSSATKAEILSFIKNAALTYSQKKVQDAALPTGQSGARCSGMSISAPHPCKANSAYYCQSAGGWTYSDSTGTTGTISKSQLPLTGSINAKVKICRKAWWGGSAYCNTKSVSVNLTANTSGTQYTYSTLQRGLGSYSCKYVQQDCTSAGGTILKWSSLPSSQRRAEDKYMYPESNTSSGYDTDIARYYTGNNTYEGPFDMQAGGKNPLWSVHWSNNAQANCYVRCRQTACG